MPVIEPTRDERLQAEAELFGYTVSGHPLELFKDIAWNTYCPVNRLTGILTCRVSVAGSSFRAARAHLLKSAGMTRVK